MSTVLLETRSKLLSVQINIEMLLSYSFLHERCQDTMVTQILFRR